MDVNELEIFLKEKAVSIKQFGKDGTYLVVDSLEDEYSHISLLLFENCCVKGALLDIVNYKKFMEMSKEDRVIAIWGLVLGRKIDYIQNEIFELLD